MNDDEKTAEEMFEIETFFFFDNAMVVPFIGGKEKPSRAPTEEEIRRSKEYFKIKIESTSTTGRSESDPLSTHSALFASSKASLSADKRHPEGSSRSSSGRK